MNNNANVIVRFVVLIFSVVNLILNVMGKNPLPFSEGELYTTASAIVAGLAVIWNTWKNNSVTKKAKTADKVLAALKNGEVTVDQVEQMVETLKKDSDDKSVTTKP